ncbi:MAG: hypothetical protein KY432_04455, partial [Acidobacteria bacterium]|nr:hypothetical protein [Acidobacteriota bacterium]
MDEAPSRAEEAPAEAELEPEPDATREAELSRQQGAERRIAPSPRPGGQWMRRVWYREASVAA